MKKLLTFAAVGLEVAWCLLVLLSWLLSALMIEGVRSLLSGEGLRWLFAHFADFLASPVLVWLLLSAMAGGMLWGSGLVGGSATKERAANGRQRSRTMGLRAAAVVAVLFVAAVALLVVPPHAVLLSATGTLAHSPFSRALVPLLCLGVLLASLAYGVAARTFTSLSDIATAAVMGLKAAAPLLLLYVLIAQFLHTAAYVFVALP